MRTQVKALLLASAGLAVVLGTTGLRAQPAPATGRQDGGPIEEIIVTATKRETRLQDTPAQVSAYAAEFIERNAVREFSDLASSIPNVVAPDGVVGTPVVAIRGISSPAKGGAAAEQPVSAFLDGVFMPEGSLDDLIFDIRQIEVIRGPQGVIWGRNTLAGAISYTSQRPTETFEGSVEAGYGNYDLFQLRGAISGPVVEDKLLFRLAAAHQEQDGYSERVSGGSYGARNREGLRGSLHVRPSEPLAVTLIGDYSESTFTNVTFEYFTGPFAALAGTNGRTRRQETDFFEPSRSESKGMAGLVDYDAGAAILSSVTGYRKVDQTLNLDTDSSSLLLIHDEIESGVEQVSQEFRLTSAEAPGRRFDWMLGVYYYRRDQAVDQFERIGAEMAGLPPGGEARVEIDFDNEVESRAAFGTASYELADALTAEAGLRVTRDRKRFDGAVSTTAVIPGVGTVPLGSLPNSLALTDTQVSPMATLSYRPAADILVYASWGRGHKSGGFNDSRVDQPTFDAETADSYEAGVKTAWLDERLVLNLVGFYIDYRDLQVRGVQGTTPLFRNAEQAVSKGVEAEVVARPLPNWTLSGSLAYNDAAYEDFVIGGIGPGGGDLDLSGNRMPLAPRTSLHLSSQYTQPLGGLGDGYVHGEWNRKSAYFLDFMNDPGGRQDAYDVVNARLGLALPNGIDVSVWGRNLTGSDYKVDFIGDLPPAVFGGSQFHILAPPRTYGVDVKATF